MIMILSLNLTHCRIQGVEKAGKKCREKWETEQGSRQSMGDPVALLHSRVEIERGDLEDL